MFSPIQCRRQSMRENIRKSGTATHNPGWFQIPAVWYPVILRRFQKPVVWYPGVLGRFQKAVIWYPGIFRRFQKPEIWYPVIFRRFQKTGNWYQGILRRFQKLAVWYLPVFRWFHFQRFWFHLPGFLYKRSRNWYQHVKYVKNKGVRGTPRQDLAFRAHEMRILRRSMERPLPKRKEWHMARPKGENVIRKHFKLTEETAKLLAEHSKAENMNESEYIQFQLLASWMLRLV